MRNVYENVCLVLDREDGKPIEKACHKMCTTSNAGFIENDQSNFIIFDFPKVDVRKAELHFDLNRYAIVPEIDFFFRDSSGQGSMEFEAPVFLSIFLSIRVCCVCRAPCLGGLD